MNDSSITTTVGNDLNWIKTHLILLALVVVLTFGGIYGVEAVIAKHDERVATAFQQQNSQFQKQVEQEVQSLQAQNALLTQALTQRAATEAKIPQQTATLSADQVAFSIAQAAHSKPNEVVAHPDNTVTMDLPTAQTCLADIQLVPLLQQDKKDLEAQLTNETKMYTDEVSAHKSDNEANQKTITALKAENRRSKLKWFGIGYVAGLISGLVLSAHGI